MPLERADILHLAETLLFGVVAVVTLLMVLRPMVMRLTTLVPSGAEAVLASGGFDGNMMALSGPNTRPPGWRRRQCQRGGSARRRQHGQCGQHRGADAGFLDPQGD